MPHVFSYPSADTFRRNVVTPPPQFKRGQRVKLAAELGGGLAEIVAGYEAANLWQVKIGSLQFVVSNHALKKAVPMWLPGDVVVVRWHGERSQGYTYVRGMSGWPGERAPKSDAQIDLLYLEGKVEPVLQSGGVPFDKAGRL